MSSICLDRDNLWIGTPRALYFIKDFFKGNKKASRLLNNHFITSILNDRDGNIWITTYGDGVYHIPYKNFYFSYLDNTNGLMSHSVFSVRKDKQDGSLYVGQNGGMLSRIDTLGRIRQFNLDSTGGRNSVLYISPYKKDILVGTDNNIFLLDRKSLRVRLLQAIRMIKDIKVTASGKILVAADRNLVTLGEGEPKTIPVDGLAMAVSCPDDTSFYIGTNNGLYYGTEKTEPRLANDADIRLKQSIKDLEWIDGDLWVGTSDQGDLPGAAEQGGKAVYLGRKPGERYLPAIVLRWTRPAVCRHEPRGIGDRYQIVIAVAQYYLYRRTYVRRHPRHSCGWRHAADRHFQWLMLF
ncbi:hypothetical protein MKQ70_14655 [Chitinophaga sedimenti]|uniref:two-component regulator propeller domain-containing protein n=1 Tax=Chitinophaga sedimenti TaxID=2033606 RepID=UPI002006053C|nr:two-component regulator propeller domain-containing protein [Chitinophaga sedimenti]MCK7556188.1 hypothetical protein [Chitinophaga sedimenti]